MIKCYLAMLTTIYRTYTYRQSMHATRLPNTKRGSRICGCFLIASSKPRVARPDLSWSSTTLLRYNVCIINVLATSVLFSRLIWDTGLCSQPQLVHLFRLSKYLVTRCHLRPLQSAKSLSTIRSSLINSNNQITCAIRHM